MAVLEVVFLSGLNLLSDCMRPGNLSLCIESIFCLSFPSFTEELTLMELVFEAVLHQIRAQNVEIGKLINMREKCFAGQHTHG